jgi:hypothetical protein
MLHKTIIDRAMRIVRSKLDDVENDESVTIGKDELTNISTALAIASILCRVNDERNDR